MKWVQGSTRWVLLIGNYALKFPSLHSWRMFLQGLLGNMREAEFNTLHWPELCPVLWSVPGGWLVCMPRAVAFTETDMADPDLGWLIDRMVAGFPVERKASSFGYLNGEVVILDYGN